MRLYVRLLDEDAPRWWDGGLEERKRTNAGACAVRGVEEMPRGLREAVETPSVWRFWSTRGDDRRRGFNTRRARRERRCTSSVDRFVGA